MQVIDDSDDEPQESEDKKIENFEFELDQVYDMLNRLTSKDKTVSRFVAGKLSTNYINIYNFKIL